MGSSLRPPSGLPQEERSGALCGERRSGGKSVAIQPFARVPPLMGQRDTARSPAGMRVNL